MYGRESLNLASAGSDPSTDGEGKTQEVKGKMASTPRFGFVNLDAPALKETQQFDIATEYGGDPDNSTATGRSIPQDEKNSTWFSRFYNNGRCCSSSTNGIKRSCVMDYVHFDMAGYWNMIVGTSGAS